jgi:AraC-like DNA-binding protein
MRTIALTRSGIVFPITGFLTRIGAPVEELLTRSGLPASILADPEGLIPTAGVVRLLNHAARSEGIDNLGLLAGHEARLDTLGVFGRGVCSASTLGGAIRAETRLHPAFSSNGRTWIVAEGDRVRFCQGFTNRFDAEWQQANHYILMLMLAIVRLGAGTSWRPEHVELQTGASQALRDFEPFSDAEIQFGRPVTTIAFPRALLDAPIPRPNQGPGTSDVSVDEWLASAPADDFAGSILQVIHTLSWDGYPHIRATAAALGLSVRTLQRHLTSAGTTHESMVGQARFTNAAALLTDTNATILDIALDLGYSDHAHFTRAFRRWAGCSPQEFRRAHRTGAKETGPDSELRNA